MPFTSIWSDFGLKELPIEFKNVRIEVRTRKIWPYKVGVLKVCRELRNCVPKGCNLEA